MKPGRRSTLETLTAEQAAFLGTGATSTPQPAIATSARKDARRPAPKPHAREHSATQRPPPKRPPLEPLRKPRSRALQSITVRVDPRVFQALRRASTQRSLDYIEPYSQRAIAEAAIARWLEDEGYVVD